MAWLKIIHIATAMLWLGNFVITGVWSARAFASGSPQLRRFAAREIIFTDIVFTLIVGAAVIMSGIGLSAMMGMNPWAVVWTRLALVTSILSGVAWITILLPLELRLQRQAASDDLRTTTRTFLWWSILGWLITVALFSIIYLMVARPT